VDAGARGESKRNGTPSAACSGVQMNWLVIMNVQ
jgi:hypothetical protein